MRRCVQHGRYGCADYECQRAETARAAGPPTELNDAPPTQAQADATTTSDDATGEPDGRRDEETW